MSLTLTFEEKVRFAQWILANFDVNQERKVMRIPTDVEGEAVEISLQTVVQALKDAVAQAFRDNKDPWIYVAKVQVPESKLSVAEKCFNQYIKRMTAEKLGVSAEFLDEVMEWLK